MPNYNYKKDKIIAEKTGIEVANILLKLGFRIIGFCEDNRFDILAKLKYNFYLFEIKEDFTCEKTGNIGLEFEHKGRPSGIAVSIADFYIYKIHTTADGIKFCLIKKEKLKELIKNKRYYKIVDGGDKDSHSMNYIFKCDIIVDNGTLL